MYRVASCLYVDNVLASSNENDVSMNLRRSDNILHNLVKGIKKKKNGHDYINKKAIDERKFYS